MFLIEIALIARLFTFKWNHHFFWITIARVQGEMFLSWKILKLIEISDSSGRCVNSRKSPFTCWRECMDLPATVRESCKLGIISISGLRDFQTWLMYNVTSRFLRWAVHVCGYWTLQVPDQSDILLASRLPHPFTSILIQCTGPKKSFKKG